MNEKQEQNNARFFESELTGIYDPPAELFAQSASRAAAAARRYSSRLAQTGSRLSDAQFRRIDELQQCAQFFWMCCELVEENPDFAIQLLDQHELPWWDRRPNAARSLFQMYQRLPYTFVLGFCLETLLALATDRHMPSIFSSEDLHSFLRLSLRFPQPEVRGVNLSGEVTDAIADETADKIRQLIENWPEGGISHTE